jgi:hypothetical protein
MSLNEQALAAAGEPGVAGSDHAGAGHDWQYVGRQRRLMNEELSRCCEADRARAAETGEQIFIRPAEEPEVALFKRMVGEIHGEGPRTLYVIIAGHGRVLVSAPRDVPLPQYDENELKYLINYAMKTHPAAVVAVDLARKN